jgi:hypothetical protein
MLKFASRSLQAVTATGDSSSPSSGRRAARVDLSAATISSPLVDAAAVVAIDDPGTPCSGYWSTDGRFAGHGDAPSDDEDEAERRRLVKGFE